MILAEWTAHPARRRPRDVALVACVVCLTASAVLTAFQSAFLVLLAVAVLLVSVSPFLLPTRYRLTEEGVEEKRFFSRRRRAWADLRRLQIGTRAALVSPFSSPTWLDRYRGLTLFLDGADRDQVIAILRQRIHGD